MNDARDIARALIHGGWVSDPLHARKAGEAAVAVMGTSDYARLLAQFGPGGSAAVARIAAAIRPWFSDDITPRQAAAAITEGKSGMGKAKVVGVRRLSEALTPLETAIRDALRQSEREGGMGLSITGTVNRVRDRNFRFYPDEIEAALAELVKKGAVVRRGMYYQSRG